MNAPEECFTPREAVLIGLDRNLQEQLAGFLRERGWRISFAETGPEGRLLARRLRAALVVIGQSLPCESARLTCAKLRYEPGPPTVVMVVDEDDHTGRKLAHFLGARYQLRQDDRFGGVPGLDFRPQPVAALRAVVS